MITSQITANFNVKSAVIVTVNCSAGMESLADVATITKGEFGIDNKTCNKSVPL